MKKYALLMIIALVFVSSAFALGKTIQTPDGEELVIDYEKSTVSYEGIETPIILDKLIYPEGTEEASEEDNKAPQGFVRKPYYDIMGNVSLDIYIEENFYYANQAALDDFWDKFNVRFEILKEETGWSSKKWFGVPLEIYNYGHSAACYGGNASPTHANVVFSDPMYKTGCNKPYYTEFNGTKYWNNTGELGDWWPYMNTALHEAQHSISPYPIYTRSWLTEGFSEYLMYNILVTSGDINQATADTYLWKGFAGYQWDPYVANDYHDTTIYNRELQRSHGYDITGWLMSKMRDEEGMDWEQFYNLMNSNKESLDRTFSLGPPYIYYTDAFVINVFGKAMGHTDYWSETDPMFNYYSGGGIDGHGYGARNISYSWHSTNPQPYADFDWFGELMPTEITFSNNNPEPDETITITGKVENTGDVNLKNNSIRFYVDDELVSEQFADINKNNYVELSTDYAAEPGNHSIEVRVDEENIKIEMDDYNNNLEQALNVEYPPTAPELTPIGTLVTGERKILAITAEATDVNGDELTYSINDSRFTQQDNVFTWSIGYMDSGEYNFLISVTDGQFWVFDTVHVIVEDTCNYFDKKLWRWNCDPLPFDPEQGQRIEQIIVS